MEIIVPSGSETLHFDVNEKLARKNAAPNSFFLSRISAPWFMPRVWTNACEKGESVTGRGANACSSTVPSELRCYGMDFFLSILTCFDRFYSWPPSPKPYPQRNCQTATHRNTLASVTKFRKRRGIELLLWPESSSSWPVSDDAAARTIASLIIKYLWRLSFIFAAAAAALR